MKNIQEFGRFAANESQEERKLYTVEDAWQEAFVHDVFDNREEAAAFMEDMVERAFEEEAEEGLIDSSDFDDEDEYEAAVEEQKDKIRKNLLLDEYDTSDPEKTAQAFDLILAAYYMGPRNESETCELINKAVAFGADINSLALIDSMEQDDLFDMLHKISEHEPQTRQLLMQIPDFARHGKKQRGKKMFGV